MEKNTTYNICNVCCRITDMESLIIAFLETRPNFSADTLQIAKGVDKISAKDVNPTLYPMEKNGLLRLVSGNTNRKTWQLIKENGRLPSDVSADGPRSDTTCDGGNAANNDRSACGKWNFEVLNFLSFM
jgi:hypothetical protein